MQQKKILSMNDISHMAGVSVATVSRVINQNGRYSAETERKVRAIIEQYQYTPNLAAKGLKTRTSNFVGIIVPDITNEFFARIVQEIQYGLCAQGYMAFICNTGEDEALEKTYMSMLSAVNLAGLIFVSGSTRTVENGLQALPTVYIDRAPNEQNRDAIVVESDNYGGAQLAVEELYEKGCRRIAFLETKKNISTYSARFCGYRDKLAQYKLDAKEMPHIQVEEITFLAARRAVSKALDENTVFDGVFCATDQLALGAMAALEDRGFRIPEDVKIVGFDDISVAGIATKPLTTIHQNTDILGQTAACELLQLIGGTKHEAHRIQIDVALVKRKTT